MSRMSHAMSDSAEPAVNRKLLIVLGSVVALAALFLGVVKPLLLSGDDLEQSIPVAVVPDEVAGGEVAPGQVVPGDVVPGAGAQPAPAPAASEYPALDAPVPETFEVFNARDPFHQLVQVPEEGAAEVVPAPGDGTTAITTVAAGQVPSVDAARVGETVVALVEVVTDDAGTPRAHVSVNGDGHEAAEGETFAEHLRVVDISGDCATLLFGDQRFTLCPGEEVRK